MSNLFLKLAFHNLNDLSRNMDGISIWQVFHLMMIDKCPKSWINSQPS